MNIEEHKHELRIDTAYPWLRRLLVALSYVVGLGGVTLGCFEMDGDSGIPLIIFSIPTAILLHSTQSILFDISDALINISKGKDEVLSSVKYGTVVLNSVSAKLDQRLLDEEPIPPVQEHYPKYPSPEPPEG